MKSELDYTRLFIEWKANIEIPDKPNEWEVKQLLRNAGLPVPVEYLLRADESVREKTECILSSKDSEESFAVKLCSADVLHKTDVNGVSLCIPGEELFNVLEEFRFRFKGDHLIISPMLPIKGPEFILGALADPVFGSAVMAGAGGILTELYKDVSFRLAPCSTREAGYLLDELTIAPVLSGYRGSNMDLENLKKILSRFSLLSAAVTVDGVELDINPLVWTGTQWSILDAKAVFKSKD